MSHIRAVVLDSLRDAITAHAGTSLTVLIVAALVLSAHVLSEHCYVAAAALCVGGLLTALTCLALEVHSPVGWPEPTRDLVQGRSAPVRGVGLGRFGDHRDFGSPGTFVAASVIIAALLCWRAHGR